MLSFLSNLPPNTHTLTLRFDMLHGPDNADPYTVATDLDWDTLCGLLEPISSTLRKLVVSLPLMEPFSRNVVEKTERAKVMEDAIKEKMVTRLSSVSDLCVVQEKSKTGCGVPVKLPSPREDWD